MHNFVPLLKFLKQSIGIDKENTILIPAEEQQYATDSQCHIISLTKGVFTIWIFIFTVEDDFDCIFLRSGVFHWQVGKNNQSAFAVNIELDNVIISQIQINFVSKYADYDIMWWLNLF